METAIRTLLLQKYSATKSRVKQGWPLLLAFCNDIFYRLGAMFENIHLENARPGKGKLLISEPFMYDPNFKRTVILLSEHSDKGTIGFIINKKLDLKIHEAVDEFPFFNSPVYSGGPVQPDTLHYIHRNGHLIEDSMKVADGIWWGGDFEMLKSLIEKKQVKPEDFRFFVGYSGWGSGQLAEEIKEKSWILTRATESNVFDDNTEKLWKDVLTQMGKEYAVMATFPEDPSMN